MGPMDVMDLMNFIDIWGNPNPPQIHGLWIWWISNPGNLSLYANEHLSPIYTVLHQYMEFNQQTKVNLVSYYSILISVRLQISIFLSKLLLKKNCENCKIVFPSLQVLLDKFLISWTNVALITKWYVTIIVDNHHLQTWWYSIFP